VHTHHKINGVEYLGFWKWFLFPLPVRLGEQVYVSVYDVMVVRFSTPNHLPFPLYLTAVEWTQRLQRWRHSKDVYVMWGTRQFFQQCWFCKPRIKVKSLTWDSESFESIISYRQRLPRSSSLVQDKNNWRAKRELTNKLLGRNAWQSLKWG
jgi:hypothetical protein